MTFLTLPKVLFLGLLGALVLLSALTPVGSFSSADTDRFAVEMLQATDIASFTPTPAETASAVAASSPITSTTSPAPPSPATSDLSLSLKRLDVAQAALVAFITMLGSVGAALIPVMFAQRKDTSKAADTTTPTHTIVAGSVRNIAIIIFIALGMVFILPRVLTLNSSRIDSYVFDALEKEAQTRNTQIEGLSNSLDEVQGKIDRSEEELSNLVTQAQQQVAQSQEDLSKSVAEAQQQIAQSRTDLEEVTKKVDQALASMNETRNRLPTESVLLDNYMSISSQTRDLAVTVEGVSSQTKALPTAIETTRQEVRRLESLVWILAGVIVLCIFLIVLNIVATINRQRKRQEREDQGISVQELQAVRAILADINSAWKDTEDVKEISEQLDELKGVLRRKGSKA